MTSCATSSRNSGLKVRLAFLPLFPPILLRGVYYQPLIRWPNYLCHYSNLYLYSINKTLKYMNLLFRNLSLWRLVMNNNIFQRAWWRLLRVFQLDKLSWDKQFEAGVWCRGPQCPETLKLVQQLCKNGNLLEFDCGEGNLPFSLPAGTFSSYLGYDISQIAIEKAKRRVVEQGVKEVQFESCKMEEWDGSQDISLILVEECLYYLSASECEKFLLKCSKSLTSEGRILVIVHSATKHKKTLDICRRVCKIIYEQEKGNRTYLTLAA